MCPLLNPDIDSKPRRESLLEPHPYTEADDCGEGAVGYRWRDEDGALS